MRVVETSAEDSSEASFRIVTMSQWLRLIPSFDKITFERVASLTIWSWAGWACSLHQLRVKVRQVLPTGRIVTVFKSPRDSSSMWHPGLKAAAHGAGPLPVQIKISDYRSSCPLSTG